MYRKGNVDAFKRDIMSTEDTLQVEYLAALS